MVDLKEAYLSNIPFHQEVISGGYYVDPPPNIEGNPYFHSKSSIMEQLQSMV